MDRYNEYRESGAEWLGEIPRDWPMLFLSQVATQVKNKNTQLEEQNLLSLSYGRIKRKPIDTNGGLLPASFDGYNIIEKNDIVLRLTDLQNDHTSLRVGLSPERGIITSAYVTLRPRDKDTALYLYYILHTFDIRKGLYGMGSGVRQGLNYEEIKKIQIPFPSTSEQSAIASYLDDKVTRIDTLISEAKASIEEYKAWKASIIYEAVTKGLDPCVEMKDSGVEWIGRIPSHWNVARVKNVADVLRGGSPRPIEDYLTDDPDGLNWIKIGDTIKGQRYIKAVKQKIRRNGLSKTRLVHKGDLLLTNSMSFGQPYILDIDGCIHDGWVCLSNIRIAKKEFLYYYLCSDLCMTQFKQQVAGGVVQNLNIDKIGSTIILLPPIGEQEKIVEHLDSLVSRIGEIISEKESLISDLEAYKKSLIFEVVTGKRKVG